MFGVNHVWGQPHVWGRSNVSAHVWGLHVWGRSNVSVNVTPTPNFATPKLAVNVTPTPNFGKLIASTFCVRPKPGAPVSMPVKWSEVTNKLRPDTFNIKNAPARLKRMKKDPGIGVINEQVDLLSVLEKLTREFSSLA